MTNPSIFTEIKDIIYEINSEIADEEVEDRDASDIISNLTEDGGGIEVIGDEFHPIHEDVKKVKSRVKDQYSVTYGIDGSTTKDLSFNNGLILSISVAGASVTNSEELYGVSDKSTVSVVAYFDENDIDINPSSTDNTKTYFDQFPRVTTLSSDLSNWINSISRTQSEGKHLEWISGKIDGPLFVDGPLFPPELLIWLACESKGDLTGTPMVDWSDKIHEIMESYISGLENCVVGGHPIYGVQKSTTSTRILDALVEKNAELNNRDIPWTNDGTLVNSALQSNSDDTTIGYTPWYIEHEFDIRGIGKVTPFKNNENIELELGTFEDYKRVFFFAKPPTESTVYRIGVPKIVFDTHNKNLVRDIALLEMIKPFREPLPVVVADEKVRIPRNIRDNFRRLINAESHKDKNEQRGYK